MGESKEEQEGTQGQPERRRRTPMTEEEIKQARELEEEK